MRKESVLGLVGGVLGIVFAVILLYVGDMFSNWGVDTSELTARALRGLVASAVGMGVTMFRRHVVWGIVAILAGVVVWEALDYLGIPTLIFFGLAGAIIAYDAYMRPEKTKEDESLQVR